MNFRPTDQTGSGYSPGGFAPSPADAAAARRNKYEMDRMADAMQMLDPAHNHALATMVRTQIKNGDDPAEARRAAFGSVPGQALSDFMMGLRRTGFLGQGDPIAYGANILQGVAGGGFTMDVLNSGGRSAGMNQQVMGGGLLSGQASIQMAKDVMTNLYGEGSTDPKKLYGHNMEDASQVFRVMAERGSLGKIGTLHQYGDKATSPDAIKEKIANAKRQEVDQDILGALEGTDAENIDAKIKQALKDGDKKVSTALTEIKSASSTFVLDDKNTKRVTDITKETLKGLSNLKDIYGEMNNPQLLAQMESLSGIRITNQAEAKKASNMTRSMVNTAEATGNDPRAVMGLILAQQASTQSRLAQGFGEELGEGGTRSATGRAIAAQMSKANVEASLRTEAAQRDNATRINKELRTNLQPRTAEELLADNKEQTAVWTEQNQATVLVSGLANSTFKNDAEFTRRQREVMEAQAKATDADERAAAESMAEQLAQEYTGVASKDYLESRHGMEAIKSADHKGLNRAARLASAAASDIDVSKNMLNKTGQFSGEELDLVTDTLKMELGASGLATLADPKTREAQMAELKKKGFLTDDSAAAVGKALGALSPEQIRTMITDVGNAAGGPNSRYDIDVAERQAESRINKQQRNAYSDEKGLSLKKIANAVLSDPEKKGFDTDAKKNFALDALQKEGFAKDLAPTARINSEDGYSADELAKIDKASGKGDTTANILKQMGLTQEEFLEKQKGGDGQEVKRRFAELMEGQTGLSVTGTADDTVISNTEQDEKRDAYVRNYELAIRYGQLAGVEEGDTTNPAMREIIETGKVSKGGLGIGLKTDEKGQAIYNNDAGYGDWDPRNMLVEKDKVHLKNAAKIRSIADRTNSKEEGAMMIQMNNLSGGQLLEGMEKQLSVLKDAQDRGAKTIDTKDADGKNIRQDVGESIKSLTDAIAKMKSDDGKGTVTKEMTVEVMVVKRQEP